MHESDIFTVRGNQTFELRGAFLPLVGIDHVFHWHGVGNEPKPAGSALEKSARNTQVDVVVLQSAERVLGLRVDELLGSQDVVIKSFSDNFVPVRGLSGASVLGDGSVALMLDVGPVIQLASRSTREM